MCAASGKFHSFHFKGAPCTRANSRVDGIYRTGKPSSGCILPQRFDAKWDPCILDDAVEPIHYNALDSSAVEEALKSQIPNLDCPVFVESSVNDRVRRELRSKQSSATVVDSVPEFVVVLGKGGGSQRSQQPTKSLIDIVSEGHSENGRHKQSKSPSRPEAPLAASRFVVHLGNVSNGGWPRHSELSLLDLILQKKSRSSINGSASRVRPPSQRISGGQQSSVPAGMGASPRQSDQKQHNQKGQVAASGDDGVVMDGTSARPVAGQVVQEEESTEVAPELEFTAPNITQPKSGQEDLFFGAEDPSGLCNCTDMAPMDVFSCQQTVSTRNRQYD